MGDGGITANLDAYELIGLPWTTFFHTNGVAFHGTFWHDNFEAPMSQGYVNIRNRDDLWRFRWCAPAYRAEVGFRRGRKLVAPGTHITILGDMRAEWFGPVMVSSEWTQRLGKLRKKLLISN